MWMAEAMACPRSMPRTTDCGLHEFVDDLAFVGHGRRVNGNALMVLAAVQIILKICSNSSGEKIKTKCRVGMRRRFSKKGPWVPERKKPACRGRLSCVCYIKFASLGPATGRRDVLRASARSRIY
jgi:hypothetical protein